MTGRPPVAGDVAWPASVVAPGTGHPADPADGGTPVARGPVDVVRLAAGATDAAALDARATVCRACRRLVAHRERVAAERVRRHAHEHYWGRPVAGLGPADARVVVVGLAPGAHGANRTGRVFTGDDSGDWLYRALHRAGLASSPTSRRADDGLVLHGCRVVCPVRCAPPDNRPAADELATCRPWLLRELELLRPTARVVVALGGVAWTALWTALPALGRVAPRPRPRFGHGVEVTVDGLVVLGSYHPSRQNTSTGRLTAPMLAEVFARAQVRAGG